MGFFKELYTRLKSKTPTFFYTLQKFFIALGVFGSSVAGYGEYMGWVPTWVLPVCFSCSAVGMFMSQLTVTNPSQLNEPQNPNQNEIGK